VRAIRSWTSSSGPRPTRSDRRPRTLTTPSSASCDWLAAFLAFVRLFRPGHGLVPQVEPRQLERALLLLDRVDDETVLRLVRLLDGLPEAEVLALLGSLSRLSPDGARRATKLMSGVLRTIGR
jgi:hypothetical protein